MPVQWAVMQNFGWKREARISETDFGAPRGNYTGTIFGTLVLNGCRLKKKTERQ